MAAPYINDTHQIIVVIKTKTKGTAAERNLIHQFWQAGWAAIRVAGSGAIKYPVPDIIAGNALRRLAIEVKATKEDARYISKEQILGLREFCQLFGAEPWVAVKFDNRGWFFVSVEQLRETAGAFVLDHEKAEMLGLSFDEMIERKVY